MEHTEARDSWVTLLPLASNWQQDIPRMGLEYISSFWEELPHRVRLCWIEGCKHTSISHLMCLGLHYCCFKYILWKTYLFWSFKEKPLLKSTLINCWGTLCALSIENLTYSRMLFLLLRLIVASKTTWCRASFSRRLSSIFIFSFHLLRSSHWINGYSTQKLTLWGL